MITDESFASLGDDHFRFQFLISHFPVPTFSPPPIAALLKRARASFKSNYPVEDSVLVPKSSSRWRKKAVLNLLLLPRAS